MIAATRTSVEGPALAFVNYEREVAAEARRRVIAELALEPPEQRRYAGRVLTSLVEAGRAIGRASNSPDYFLALTLMLLEGIERGQSEIASGDEAAEAVPGRLM